MVAKIGVLPVQLRKCCWPEPPRRIAYGRRLQSHGALPAAATDHQPEEACISHQPEEAYISRDRPDAAVHTRAVADACVKALVKASRMPK